MNVSLLTNSMAVEGDIAPEKIIKAVEDAGYGAKVDKGDTIAAMNALAEELLSGQKTIQAYAYTERAKERFAAANKEAADGYYEGEYQGAAISPTINFISYLSLALIAMFGAVMYMMGNVSLGQISSFILYSRKFSGPIDEISSVLNEIFSALAAAERVFELLDVVHLSEKVDAYPSQLSGGQKQRVAIARALADEPRILLSDEATSALDPDATESILSLLRDLNRQLGITIVLITHEMAVIKSICNKVSVMEPGIVAETGNVYDIFTDPKEEITKTFIKTTSNVSKVYEFVENDAEVVRLKPGEVLASLHYKAVTVSEPVITTAARNYSVYLNILFADVEIIDGKSIGDTVCIISGTSGDVSSAIAYIEKCNIEVEVIKDARISA